MNLSTYSGECERVVADLIGYMTPLEKAGQLAIRSAPATDDREALDILIADLKRGCVGSIRQVADKEQASFLQQIARDETRLGIPLLFTGQVGHGLETVIPMPLAAAASWDPDSLEAAAGIVAQEAEVHGFNWVFGTEARLVTSRGGTSPHASGEQPYLAAAMAVAQIRGLQGAAARKENGILATLDISGLASKEKDGVSDAARLLSLASAAVTSGNVAAIEINSSTRKQRVDLADALRTLAAPGGFDGILLTQWQDLAGSLGEEQIDITRHGVPLHLLLDALENDRIDKRLVDEAVARVLRVKFQHGLLRAALAAPMSNKQSSLPTPVHNRETALELARRCPVLLRNDPALLPLGIDSGDVLLVGQAAKDRHIAMGDAQGVAASILDGFEQLGIPHRYVPGLALRGEGIRATSSIAADSMAIGMANEAAKRAGTVILVLENDERGDFGDAQQQLLEALANANRKLVLVNLGPTPVDPWIGGKPLAGSMHVGQLGTMSGHAVAELLSGEFAPCGKLPVAIPASGQSPSLPFGYGLNYADFALTHLTVEQGRERIYASAQLRNVSDADGTEIVQLYLRRISDAGIEEKPRLVDFQRVSLRPGQCETLMFDVGRAELGRHHADGSFQVEPGSIELFMGLSSKRGIAANFDLGPGLARAIANTGVHPRTPTLPRSQQRSA